MLTGQHVQTMAAAVAIIGTLVTLTIYIDRLDARVSQLEERSHAPDAATPSAAGADKGVVVSQAGFGSIAQVCADLARRSADEIGKGAWLTSDQMQKTLSAIGCLPSPSPRSPE